MGFGAGSLIFVYGTLRPGERASLLGNPMVEHICEDKLNGRLYSLGGFPGLVAEPCHFDLGKPFVAGDVFRLRADEIAAQLDRYEGYPSFYNRIETETALGHHVWAYTYNHEVSPDMLITSGDWRKDRMSTYIEGQLGEQG